MAGTCARPICMAVAHREPEDAARSAKQPVRDALRLRTDSGFLLFRLGLHAIVVRTKDVDHDVFRGKLVVPLQPQTINNSNDNNFAQT